VPDFEMPTQESRRKLPRQLSREDTVFNVSRVALLVAALGARRYDLLDEATQDRIHQPARRRFKGLVPIMDRGQGSGRCGILSVRRRLHRRRLRPGGGGAGRAADDAGGDRPRFQRPQHHHQAHGRGAHPSVKPNPFGRTSGGRTCPPNASTQPACAVVSGHHEYRTCQRSRRNRSRIAAAIIDIVVLFIVLVISRSWRRSRE
jgi:hypothetical protein